MVRDGVLLAREHRPELRWLVPFRECSDDELQRVLGLVERRAVPADTRLVRAGEQGERLFVVVSGSVRVHNAAGLDHLLGPGDVVGELSVLGGEPSTADVDAVTASELLVVDAADLPALLEIAPVARRLRSIGRARLAAEPGTAVEAASVTVFVPRPHVRGVGAGMHARSDVPARPVRSAVLILLALIVGGASTWFVLERDATTAVDIGDVLADARADGAAPATTTGRPAAVPGPAGRPADAQTAQRPGTVEPDAPVPVDEPAAPATPPPAPASGDEPAPGARFQLPAPGVYSYATTGSERINLGASHTYPDETHAIVRHTGGCGWEVEHRVIEEHVDQHERCTTADAVSVVADGRDVEFFGQRDGLTYSCDPPVRALSDAPAGTVTTGSCPSEDGSSVAAYEVRFVGIEQVEVGGQDVRTAHLHVEFVMTGDARGTSTADFWVQPDTGLIVRQHRVVDTYARAAWGDVRYQEEATFHLLSLTPRG